MNAVGIFAGRGDVVLAMGLAFILGWVVCLQYVRIKSYLIGKFSKVKND